MACVLGCVAFVETVFFFYLRRRSQQLLLIRAMYKQQLAALASSLNSGSVTSSSSAADVTTARLDEALSKASVEERRERSRRLADILLAEKRDHRASFDAFYASAFDGVDADLITRASSVLNAWQRAPRDTTPVRLEDEI